MWKYTFVENGRNIVRPYHCKFDQHGEVCGSAIDRLAEYEDIGLSPEEIKELLRHRHELIAEMGGKEGAAEKDKPLTLDELTEMAQKQRVVWVTGEYDYEEPAQGLLSMDSHSAKPCVYVSDLWCRHDPIYSSDVSIMLANGLRFYREKPLVTEANKDLWGL